MMRNISIALLCLLINTKLTGNDLEITFSGSGITSVIDSVVAVNLSANIQITVPCNETLILRDIQTAFDENKMDIFIKFYPNPFDDKTKLLLYLKDSQNIDITITDMNGKTVAQLSKFGRPGRNEFEISCEKRGYYLVNINCSEEKLNYKILCNSSVKRSNNIFFTGSGQLSRKQSTENNCSFSMKKNAKVYQSTFELNYSEGDIILYKFMSGKNATIITDSASSSKKLTAEFIKCTDYDSNNYAVVKIGNKIWMAENLRTTRFSNGDTIETTAPSAKDISGETTPKYQWIYNDDLRSLYPYGRLYTWHVVTDGRFVCPVGWHIPSKDEFTELINLYGGTGIAGVELKESGNSHWQNNVNFKRTNKSGFSAVPGGLRTNITSKEYDGMGIGCYFWTSTKDNQAFPYHIGLFYDNPNAFISPSYHPAFNGFSVRCIKDTSH